jgi:hypothetical protein
VRLTQNLWRELGTAAAWAASLCGGLASSVACRPFRPACLLYFPIGVAWGSILFFLVFVVEVFCVMLLFRIAAVRHWLLRPAPILIIVVLQAIIGYVVFPSRGAP